MTCTRRKISIRQKDTVCILSSEFEYFSSSICKLYSKPDWRKASICTGWWCAKAQRGCWDLLLIHGIVLSDAATSLCIFSTRFVFHPLYVFRQSCAFMNVEPNIAKLFRSCSKELLANVRHYISLVTNMLARWLQHQLHLKLLPVPCL